MERRNNNTISLPSDTSLSYKKQSNVDLLDAVRCGQNPATFDDASATDVDPLTGWTTHEALEAGHEWPRMRSRLSSTDDA